MFVTRVWLIRVLVLVCLASGTLGVSDAVQTDEFPPTVRTESGANWNVSGIITGPDEKPVSDAKIFLTYGSFYQPMGTAETGLSDFVESDRQGNYRIEIQENRRMLFLASGLAPLNVSVPEGSGMDVQLSRGRTISGTILDPTGEPSAGADVKPVQWLIPKPESQQVKVDAKRFKYDRGMTNNIAGAYPDFGSAQAVKTDQEGRFTIKNLPEDFRVGLSVKVAEAKEELVFVRPVGDTAGPDFEGQVLRDDGFSFQSESGSVLKIEATDAQTGQPAAISNVYVEGFTVGRDNRPEKFNSSSVAVTMRPDASGSTAWIVPKESSRLLGIRLQLPPNGETDIITKEVQFQTGKTVRGTVTSSETGDPLKGVQIMCLTRDGQQLMDSEGNFAKMVTKTDRDGRFELAVPDVDGIIGVTGDVPGHRSVSNWIHRELYEKFAPELLDEFTRKLNQGQIDNLEELKFELEPSYVLEIDVIGTDGEPVRNCIILGDRKRSIVGEINAWQSVSISQTTDENGQATVDHWYHDAFLLAQARYLIDHPDESRNYTRHYPATIQAFTEDGFNQGSVVIPLPAKNAESRVIPVTIELLEPGDVLGRIVNLKGEGIADLEVQALSGSWTHAPGQVWKTKTRNDGRFKMCGLTIGSQLKWELDRSRVKTSSGRGGIEIDISELKQGETLEIEPIVVLDLTPLTEELPEIEIGGLSSEAALEVLMAYVEESFARAPTGPAEFFSRRSSNKITDDFMRRVAKKTQTVVEELAARDPGGNSELRLLSTMLDLYQSRREFIRPGADLKEYCLERLIKNQIQNIDAQDSILKQMVVDNSYQTEQRWIQLRGSSPFPPTRAFAFYRLAPYECSQILRACRNDAPPTAFDKQLVRFETYLASEKDCSNVTLPELDQVLKLREKYRSSILNVETTLNPAAKSKTRSNQQSNKRPAPELPPVVKSRADKVLKLLKNHILD